jgi:hypothetical protein
MELIHLATTKTPAGLHEVDVSIDGKRYSFMVRSEQDVEAFEAQYRAGRKLLGRALDHLKKNQVKDEGGDAGYCGPGAGE